VLRRDASVFMSRSIVQSLMVGAVFLAPALSGQELGPAPRVEFDIPLSPPRPERLSVSVAVTNRADVVQFYQTVYMASEGVDAGWNGDCASCTAGTTSQAYIDATILRVNYYRAMVGLPGNVTADPTWNVKAQQAALMMSKQRSLSHSPGTSWACYTAQGAEAAGKSNLALGADAAFAVDLYMDDSGSGNAAVGHRRWILYPPEQVMGVGNVPGDSTYLPANALWVIGGVGSRPASPAWVAWPPPGFIPYQVMPATSGRWSFAYPDAAFTNAVVSMRCMGTNVPVTRETFAKGYGDNTLVWRPDGVPTAAPGRDLVYSVSISNVVVSGKAKAFAYEVTIINPIVPELAIEPAGVGAVSISWSAESTGYQLVSAQALGVSAAWTAVAAAPQRVGDRYVVVLPVTSSNSFYCLQMP